MSQKILRDAIHGYISLDDMFIFIIDSPEFQRLKSIEQGSFRVLYPAARHDRFIHSLGTYHLAKKVSHYFIQNIKLKTAAKSEKSPQPTRNWLQGN